MEMSLTQKIKSRLTATTLALGLAFAAAAPAIAQDASANENVQQASLQVTIQSITAEEAKELSKPQYEGGPSKIILRVGNNFDAEVIDSLQRRLHEKNINAEFFYSGQDNDILKMYFDGSEFAKDIPQVQADRELVPFISALAHQQELNITLAQPQPN
jgi:hypothetical protein